MGCTAPEKKLRVHTHTQAGTDNEASGNTSAGVCDGSGEEGELLA